MSGLSNRGDYSLLPTSSSGVPLPSGGGVPLSRRNLYLYLAGMFLIPLILYQTYSYGLYNCEYRCIDRISSTRGELLELQQSYDMVAQQLLLVRKKYNELAKLHPEDAQKVDKEFKQKKVNSLKAKQKKTPPQPTSTSADPPADAALKNTAARHTVSINTNTPITSTQTCPACPVCQTQPTNHPVFASPYLQALDIPLSPLPSTDLSSASTPLDLSSHEVEWDACTPPAHNPVLLQTQTVGSNKGREWCDSRAPENEQYFQLTLFHWKEKDQNRWVWPNAPTCTQLPPTNYQFPEKYPRIPALDDAKTAAIHWPNLRVNNVTDLLVFNPGWTKNLYHFRAAEYDRIQSERLDIAAQYIPFAQKIRLALDVGSGGGSLGLLMKRRYDVQSVSLAFADWPYCEYITERGNICLYLDAMFALPFAKFSFDLVHCAWVYHALTPSKLRDMFFEHDRILRPGGYLWWDGGWSLAQINEMKAVAVSLGYKVLYELFTSREKAQKSNPVFFDQQAHDAWYQAIWVKPIRANFDKCNEQGLPYKYMEDLKEKARRKKLKQNK